MRSLLTRRVVISVLAVTTVFGTVLPTLGAVGNDGTDARCRTLADDAARCPTHTDVATVLPSVDTRSVSLPDGRTIVLGADANLDRLAVTAYDAAGTPVYHRRSYVGGHVLLFSAGVSADARTVVAGGVLYDWGEDYRPITVAVDARTGNVRWTRIGANRGRADGVAGVAADAKRNVAYVSIFLEEKPGTYVDDLVVEAVRLSDGHLLWTKRVGRADGRDEYPVTLDFAAGRVVVTGSEQKRTQTGPGDYDYAVWVFRPRDGRLLGEVRYDSGNGDDFADAAAVTRNDRLLAVTGGSPAAPEGATTGIATLLIDPIGVRAVWTTRSDGPMPDTTPWTIGIARDHVVIGAASGAADAYSIVPQTYGELRDVHRATAIALDLRSGAQSWRQDVTEPSAPDAEVAQLAVAPDGATVYWAGAAGPTQMYAGAYSSYGGAYASGPTDSFVVAMSASDGTKRWTARWNADPQGTGQTYISSVAATAHGVVVAGEAGTNNPASGQVDDSSWTGLALSYAG